MIWATVSSWSCFCWMYRASPSLAASNIINLILVLAIWWCPCVESSLVLLEEGVCCEQCILLVKLYSHLLCFILYSKAKYSPQFSSVTQLCPTLWPHESQHARPPCPSPTPGVYSNSCPSSWWCHPVISSSVIPFYCLQSFPASGSFPMSQLFAWGGQSIGVSASASVLPMNTQDWSPLVWTGWISLKSKGLSRVFANTTVQIFPWYL